MIGSNYRAKILSPVGQTKRPALNQAGEVPGEAVQTHRKKYFEEHYGEIIT